MASSTVLPVEGTKAPASREEILSKSNFPVFLPYHEAIHLSFDDLESFIKSTVSASKSTMWLNDLGSFIKSTVSALTSTTASELSNKEKASETPADRQQSFDQSSVPASSGNGEGSASKRTRTSGDLEENQTFTENLDGAFRSTNSALIDLFFELTDATSKAGELLDKAWKEDPLKTLKLVWNTRSIHLGKSNRLVFYECYSWLAEKHPQTALLNLRWLPRPVIPKKAETKQEGAGADDDLVLVDEKAEKMTLENDSPYRWDVKHGVAHGYWKDLLNIVAFAANGQLKIDGDYKSILNPKRTQVSSARSIKKLKRKRPRRSTGDKLRSLMKEAEQGKDEDVQPKKEDDKDDNYEKLKSKYSSDPFYKALHIMVAKLFAEQIKEDGRLLVRKSKADMHKISLAAKWAPTAKGTHDKHTRILSTIAEILYRPEDVCPDEKLEGDAGRELYLRHARERLRMELISPLRKHLDVVERNITAETFSKINYSKVPSIAMSKYADLFEKKDPQHFGQYINDVTMGKATISGATLLPSSLVRTALAYTSLEWIAPHKKGPPNMHSKMKAAVMDAQWNALVQRMRDSGTMENSIAIADVSGSMFSPSLSDGTTPIDSSIGLSLLVAEVTKPPFGGMFITFSEDPRTQKVGGASDARDLVGKVQAMRDAPWGMNTDFEAVFTRLILPMAVDKKLSQEDMVKRIFVFSDMQFDRSRSDTAWSTSYQRIKKSYDKAGYEMPQLVFWNLAGDSSTKPTTADEEGVALVSGYSQGMLKVFLDGGQFEAAEANEEDVVTKDGGGDEAVVVVDKKRKEFMNSVKTMEKAISHEAYQMLRVVD